MSKQFTNDQWAELRRQSEAAVINLIAPTDLLLGYQKKAVSLLDSTAVVLFIEKSRRIGMTWGLASYAALKAARSKSAGGDDVMYISYSQEMTREFIDACAMWARLYSEAAMTVQEFVFKDKTEDGDQSIQAFRIRFDSGFEIVALSSAPRTLRGKQGVVIIDEAAFVDNLAELLKAAMAFLMWGGQVVVCSTHDGAENEFNIQIQDILGGRSNYDHMRVDLDDALLDGLYKRICLVQGKDWSPEKEAEWRGDLVDFYKDAADEELFCTPSQGSGTWLSAPLIEARMTEDAPILRLDLPRDFLQLPELERQALLRPFMEELEAALAELDPEARHAFGFDFARVADLSVGNLLAIGKNLDRRSALTIELRGVPGDEQKMIVEMILRNAPNMVGAAFDAVGMGWTVAEDMGRIFGLREKEGDSGMVWAVQMTEKWYRFNMPPVKVAFEDEALFISKDDEHLTDLRMVKVIRGTPRVPDVRTGQPGKKRHGDFVIALALAYFASRMQWHEYDYTGVGSQPSDDFNNPDRDAADDNSNFRMGQLRRTGGIMQ